MKTTQLFERIALMVLVACILAPGLLVAQTRTTSNLSMVINESNSDVAFPLIDVDTEEGIVRYDLSSGRISFSAGVISDEFNHPLFCFDFATSNGSPTLHIKDLNGYVIANDLVLDNALLYLLAPPSTVLIDPSRLQQCFYKSDLGDFGLFGKIGTLGSVPPPPDQIFGNQFEAVRSLSVEFSDFPQFVTPDQSITYDIVLTNTGDSVLQDVAFQEVYPGNEAIYSGTLSAPVELSCSPSNGAVCPALGIQPPPMLRWESMSSSTDMPVGSSLKFSVQRTVKATTLVGDLIKVYAGAVADPVTRLDTPSGAAVATMTVVGESDNLNVSASGAEANGSDTSDIVVTVLDANQNPVQGQTVTYEESTPTLNVTPASDVSDVNGQVIFNSGVSTIAGDYTVDFSAGALAGSGTVTFSAGAPDALNAVTTVDDQLANGQELVEFRVTVLDANQNEVSGAQVDVIDDGGLTAIDPETEFTDIDGNAYFTAASTEAGTYTVTFEVAGAGSDPSNATFLPGAVDDLAFVQQPPSVAAVDEPIDPPITVELLDQFGNRVITDTDTFVQLELRGPVIESEGSVQVSNGIATFPNVIASEVGSGYILRATAQDVISVFVDSNEFDVQ